ncbi:hypothetical protein GCM10027022_11800 [Alpinimonas psychrophila]|uniref:DNA polymerase III subunit gamma/tau n=1 Tax=Alpinimonas psychrophila TaxID=748908 RepID=A0A7W3PP19_9MICO|nr:hypothetical protein [Alpinimonas psychrophila]MBA8829005.1 hypothetical protein [Alpinimonas psychrophila]
MIDNDEEALAWAGDNDERLTTGSTSKSPVRKRRASPSASPDTTPTSPAAAETVAERQAVEQSWSPSENVAAKIDEDGPGGLSSREGIVLGVLGGIYLLFSAAWIVTALRNPVQIADPLGSITFIAGLWMAALAPAAWFAATLVYGRRRSFLWRFILLTVGAILVIPWPYFSWAS